MATPYFSPIVNQIGRAPCRKSVTTILSSYIPQIKQFNYDQNPQLHSLERGKNKPLIYITHFSQSNAKSWVRLKELFETIRLNNVNTSTPYQFCKLFICLFSWMIRIIEQIVTDIFAVTERYSPCISSTIIRPSKLITSTTCCVHHLETFIEIYIHNFNKFKLGSKLLETTVERITVFGRVLNSLHEEIVSINIRVFESFELFDKFLKSN